MLKPRFTTILALYQDQEAQARRRVGQLERERQTLLQRQEGIARDRQAAVGRTNVQMHDQLTRYWAQTGEELRQLALQMGRVDTAIAEARKILTQAHQRVATFEKLRARDQREHAYASERRFTRTLDEFASLMHDREPL